jgi:hypothetical protein
MSDVVLFYQQRKPDMNYLQNTNLELLKRLIGDRTGFERRQRTRLTSQKRAQYAYFHLNQNTLVILQGCFAIGIYATCAR